MKNSEITDKNEKTGTKRARWYLPHDEGSALDALENLNGVFAFLTDVLSQDSAASDTDFHLYDKGTSGFYLLLQLCEDVIEDSMSKLREASDKKDLLIQELKNRCGGGLRK